MNYEPLIGFGEAEQRYGVPRWCIRRWVSDGELSIEPDHQADDIGRLHGEGLSMQAIADHLRITKGLVQRRLAGTERADMVRVDDLERLIARQTTCPGCGKPVAPGRRWHPSCASHQPGTSEKRAAAWGDEAKAAARDRIAAYWESDDRRNQAAQRIRQRHAFWRAEVDSYRRAEGLLDVSEMVEQLGEVGWKERISGGRVRALAAEHGIGFKLPGFGRGALVFTHDDVERIRGVLKTDTKDGHCVDCRKATYASVRCKTCGDLQKGERLTALRRQLNLQIDALKAEQGLRDVVEAAVEIDRAKSKVWAWARRLDVGLRVPNILGLPERWLFSDDDLRTIRAAIDDLAERSAPGGMVAIRDSTKYPDWYLKRFKTTAKFGEYAPAIAAERGVKVGRPVELLDSERQEILRLDAEGRSQREIAAAVGVSRGKVQRLLNRPQAA